MLDRLSFDRVAAAIIALALATALVYLDAAYFPYVTPKAAWFRTWVGLITAGLVWRLYMRGGKWVGERDPFAIAFGLYVAIMAIFAMTGPAPERSLWGDFERMGGVVTLAYLWLFYIASRVLLEPWEWLNLLRVAVLVSAVVSIAAILGHRTHYPFTSDQVYVFLGSPGYLGIFLVMALGAQVVLWAETGERWPLAVALLSVYSLLLVESDSAYLALAVALFAGTAVYLLAARKTLWSAVIGLPAVAAVSAVVLFGFVGLPDALAATPPGRLIGGELESRQVIWSAARRGLNEHWPVGLGPENFELLFARHYPAAWYEVGAGMPYVDRAHNAYLDVAIAGGLPGLIAFLATYVLLLRSVIGGVRAGRLSPVAAAALAGVVLGYLAYLGFWFEDLSSSILLVFLAGFAVSAGSESPPIAWGTARGHHRFRAILAGASAVLVLAVTYHRGVRVVHAAHLSASALEEDYVEEKITGLERALRLGMPEGAGVIHRFVTVLRELGGDIDEIRDRPQQREVVRRGLEVTLDLLDDRIERDPWHDVWRLQRGHVLVLAAALLQRTDLYTEALEDYRAAVSLSLGQIRHREALADAFLIAGFTDSARVHLSAARSIRPDVPSTDMLQAKVLLMEGDLDGATRVLKRANPTGHATEWADLTVYLMVSSDNRVEGNYLAAAALDSIYLASRYPGFWLAAQPNAGSRLAMADVRRAFEIPLLFARAGANERAVESASRLAELFPEASVDLLNFIVDVRRGEVDPWIRRASLLPPSARITGSDSRR